MMRQVLSNVFVLFVNCEQDEAGINYDTHSIKQPCGRYDIKFIWQFTAFRFQIL